MADAVEAIATTIGAAIAADTGAGGLNTSGDQFLHGGAVRNGDPKETHATSYIEYSLVPLERGYEAERREVEVLTRFAIVTDRNLGFTRPNAIAGRLVALLTTTDFAASGGWNFSRVKIVRPMFLVESAPHRLRHVVEAHWTANK